MPTCFKSIDWIVHVGPGRILSAGDNRIVPEDNVAAYIAAPTRAWIVKDLIPLIVIEEVVFKKQICPIILAATIIPIKLNAWAPGVMYVVIPNDPISASYPNDTRMC